MLRILGTILSVLTLAVAARAHFIWIVPDGPDGTKAKVIFSDSLEADQGVPVEKIAATKLLVRDTAGKVAPLSWQKGEHAYLVRLPDPGSSVLGGVCTYGVIQRGQDKPFLLTYYPKWIQGEVKAAQAWDHLPLEILPQGAGRFQVLFTGKPATGAEVVVLTPTADGKETRQTDAQGEFKVRSSAPGLYGIRARHIETRAGEHEGKKYEEVRHYATLVFQVEEAQPKHVPPAAEKDAPASKVDRTATAPAYPPLPRAVSSFGAAVAGGWLYIYGGHSDRTHQYSTETVVGTFHRLALSDPRAWEELPGGPPVQGLALVAHQGKIYRIGGMQPRNQPGEMSVNHSLASCACFDPATRQWQAMSDLPTGRSSHDAVVLGDKLYVVGGWKMTGAGSKTQWHDSALVLDLGRKSPQWQPIPQPFRWRALAAAAHGGKIYVLAGLTDEGEMELAVDIYDPAAGAWSSGKDIPGPIQNGFTPASCVAGGRLYVSAVDGKVCRLSEKGDAWEDVGALQRPRFVHRMVAAGDDRLVIVGGASRQGNVASTETVEPARALGTRSCGEAVGDF